MFKRWMHISMAALVLLIGVASTAAQEQAGELDGRSSRAALRFLEGMIDHHQMALDMANHCLPRAENADVLALCQAIIDAQSAEIEQMRAWLLEWYNVDYAPIAMIPADGGMSGMDHSGHGGDSSAPVTDPPMMMGMMAGLSRVEGRDYDIAWLESMIDHHDDAVHMSTRLLRRMTQEPLRELAVNIIDAQTSEIAQMEALIVELSE